VQRYVEHQFVEYKEWIKTEQESTTKHLPIRTFSLMRDILTLCRPVASHWCRVRTIGQMPVALR